MKIICDTYEEFRKFAMDGGACPSDYGFKDRPEPCTNDLEDCVKCWKNCGMDIEIKENPKKKITLEFDLPMCPYWNPITKTAPGGTCGSCRCESEGNTVSNAEYGVMAGGDRYCCLGDNIDIRAGIVEAVKEKEE